MGGGAERMLYMPIISGAKCDVCGKMLYYKRIYGKGELTRMLRKNGWSVGEYTKCKDCRPKPKKVVL